MPLRSPSSFVRKFPEKEMTASYPIDMKNVATIILGGGQGTRLFPLTMSRCKPAMSFGGRYRLIDVPISNALNSGCQRLFVVTQFLSSSLHKHIFSTYRLGTANTTFIELLPAEERPNTKVWFEGTADAVRQNLNYFEDVPADYFLILSGDQIYHMDYRNMVKQAIETNADVVIAFTPIKGNDAKRMGIAKLDKTYKITDFIEKPQQDKELTPFSLPLDQQIQFQEKDLSVPHYLGSMGIYLFKRQTLIKLLENDPRSDFGKHLIPTQIKQGGAYGYVHHGYWEDIGTIESFYKSNIALTYPNPAFNFYNEEWKIYTSQNTLPGTRLVAGMINHSILSEGCVINESEIVHSILGPRIIIQKGTKIYNSYLIGNDFYKHPVKKDPEPPTYSIGKNCTISHAVIDKHVHIGDGVTLTNKKKLTTYDSDIAYIRDGIIVIPKGAVVPDGYTL